MKTIRLYGKLGEQFGKEHRLAVESPREAIRALTVLHKGFRKAIAEHDGPGFRILSNETVITTEELTLPNSGETIHIIPIIAGSGDDKGFMGIVLGAALIWAGMPGNFLGSLGSVGGFSIGSMAINMGVSMVLGGISNLLFSPPEASTQVQSGGSERPENKPSYSFDGPVNTTTQGNPVSLCYGRIMVGSQLVSAGFSTERISV